MKLTMSGYQAVKYNFVSEAKVKEVSGGSNKVGYFSHPAEWNDPDENGTLTLKFTLNIWINSALDEKKKGEVKAHETRHFNDFKALAANLKTSLENAMKAKRDPQIDLRMKWFNYDVCQKAAAFHREAPDGYDLEICDKPSDARPQ